MAWTLIHVTASKRAVECRICGERMDAAVRKVRLEPAPREPKLFYYFHIGCVAPEVVAAANLLMR